MSTDGMTRQQRRKQLRLDKPEYPKLALGTSGVRSDGATVTRVSPLSRRNLKSLLKKSRHERIMKALDAGETTLDEVIESNRRIREANARRTDAVKQPRIIGVKK